MITAERVFLDAGLFIGALLCLGRFPAHISLEG